MVTHEETINHTICIIHSRNMFLSATQYSYSSSHEKNSIHPGSRYTWKYVNKHTKSSDK